MSETDHAGSALKKSPCDSKKKQSVCQLYLTVVVAMGSLIIGVGRFLVPSHPLSLPGTYEAVAHIWVGFLMACGTLPTGVRVESWIGLGVITALEIFLFVWR